MERPPHLALAISALAISAALAGYVAGCAWQGTLHFRAGAAALGCLGLLILGRRSMPARLRSRVDIVAKSAFTAIGMAALLRHPIEVTAQQSEPVYRAIATYLRDVDAAQFWTFALIATAIKAIGIVASAFGWHLLLIGQGVRFQFGSGILSAFMIGRFLGTFLPSTLGLDGYTLYEAGRYSNQWARCSTAKLVEKLLGIAGLFVGMLITLPFGYAVLSDVAMKIGKPEVAWLFAIAIVVVAGGITGSALFVVLRPGLVGFLLRRAAAILPPSVGAHVQRLQAAIDAYRGQVLLLATALVAKFVAHLTTATVYYFTALAIGVVGAAFWPIVFGSTIQILATLLSPTLAGEGAREAFQALLLSHQLGGVPQAVLSAALGFLAAEAPTLLGGIRLWRRGPAWRPGITYVDDQPVDYDWLA